MLLSAPTLPTLAAGAPGPLWLSVVVVGGVVTWGGVYDAPAAAQATALAQIRPYCGGLPTTGDPAADWAALQDHLLATDDGRQAGLSVCVRPVAVVTSDPASEMPR